MTETITPSTDVRSYQWYANGQWRDAPGFFDDFEPYSGAIYAHAPNCGAEEAKIAIAAAHAGLRRPRSRRPSSSSKPQRLYGADEKR
jgi:acyl-CoA reductase-like NAD-dependent aldehyde dehydrogenase